MTKDEKHPAEAGQEDTQHDTDTTAPAKRRAVALRLAAFQGYLALVLLALGIGLEAGPGWGVAVMGLGLFADAWRDTTQKEES